MKHITYYKFFESNQYVPDKRYISILFSYWINPDKDGDWTDTVPYLSLVYDTLKNDFFITQTYWVCNQDSGDMYRNLFRSEMKSLYGEGPYTLSQIDSDKIHNEIGAEFRINEWGKIDGAALNLSVTYAEYSSDFAPSAWKAGIRKIFDIHEEIQDDYTRTGASVLEIICDFMQHDELSLEESILEILKSKPGDYIKNDIPNRNLEESEINALFSVLGGVEYLSLNANIIPLIRHNISDEIEEEMKSKFGVDLNIHNNLSDLGFF